MSGIQLQPLDPKKFMYSILTYTRSRSNDKIRQQLNVNTHLFIANAAIGKATTRLNYARKSAHFRAQSLGHY